MKESLSSGFAAQPEVAVSVIVPVYNVEDCIARCLDSVLGQTLRDMEVICVDDGSPDNSIAVLQDYARRDDRLRIVRQENRGLGGARNTGLRLARGKYVAFIDSDDEYGDSRFLEKIFDAAERHGASIAAGGILKVYPGRRKVSVAYASENVLRTPQERLAASHCPPDYYVWNKLYLRTRLAALSLDFPERVMFEDVHFTLRALTLMGDMVTVPGTAYNYIIRNNSITKSRNSRKKQADRYVALKGMVEFADAHGLEVPSRYRSIAKRSWMLWGMTLLKIRERDGWESLWLFDFIPLFRRKVKSV